jgi:hypothetical protein
MMAAPKSYRPGRDDIRFVYADRYEVHAPNKEHAARVLRQFGFINLDMAQLKHEGSNRPVIPVSIDFEPPPPKPQ